MADNTGAVIAQKAKQVGDENVADVRDVNVSVNEESVSAQVAQPREREAGKVPVQETRVTVDEVITDPSDPRAVQVPDAGRGDATTPIYNAFVDAERVEDVFAREAASADDEDDTTATVRDEA